jgi:hypothetical protein
MNLLHARCCGALEPRCVPGVLVLHGLCGRPALSTLRKWQGFAYPGHPTLTVLGSIVTKVVVQFAGLPQSGLSCQSLSRGVLSSRRQPMAECRGVEPIHFPWACPLASGGCSQCSSRCIQVPVRDLWLPPRSAAACAVCRCRWVCGSVQH